MTTTRYADEVLPCPPRAGTLYDVMELILDRGMVIDVFIRVSLVGIEILKIDARIVVASVDTYLRFAEACNRLDLERDSGSITVPELFGGQAARKIGKSKVKKKAKSVGDSLREAVGGPGDSDDEDDAYEDDDEDDEAYEEEEREKVPAGRRRRAPVRSGSASRRRSGRD
ncbi:gas vesicle protein GVPa [Streptomyces albus]|uniref:Gas vesicle protein A n=1 Tax=Streptomyces albus (strain ATCC 21838 / DSM 41398 / FERM P-419 / JCM 4703 / NBRC 107858) TaxID=1081613 RepID=A0A0B5EXW9_STRA4|nr:gas vesicle protein GVPa [Streptomyces albus]AOU78385.1 gas vesicle protein GVPa [Streptomyces albus]AYN34136.1 gas vesicle protein [Streptomyces albus]